MMLFIIYYVCNYLYYLSATCCMYLLVNSGLLHGCVVGIAEFSLWESLINVLKRCCRYVWCYLLMLRNVS